MHQNPWSGWFWREQAVCSWLPCLSVLVGTNQGGMSQGTLWATWFMYTVFVKGNLYYISYMSLLSFFIVFFFFFFFFFYFLSVLVITICHLELFPGLFICYYIMMHLYMLLCEPKIRNKISCIMYLVKMTEKKKTWKSTHLYQRLKLQQ